MTRRSKPARALDPAPQPSSAGDEDVDALTGLRSRRGLSTVLARSCDAAVAGAPPPSLLVVDLDRFRVINDSIGHATGDLVLQLVARRISASVPHGSVVARMGGDEFAVLIVDGSDAEALARQLLELASRPYAVEGQALCLSVSIGVARSPADGSDADTLLRSAELALHSAEAAGGNRLQAYQPAMRTRATKRHAVETDLRAALGTGRADLRDAMSSELFELHYQPQVCLADRRLIGFEALVRWRHPTRGLVGPDEFIPLAEEIGLIGLLGHRVLRKACLLAASWPGDVGVAVNVSPVQLREGRALVAAVAAALSESGLAPERLEIEITESALMGEVAGVMALLKDLGVALAVDDFGTGYSSLSQLGRYPFDRLKIDRSFVRDLVDPVGGANSTSRSGIATPADWMIQAIASLGAGLGMATIAEGVETELQARLLQVAGVMEIQGFLISPPVPAAEVPDLIRTLSHND